MTSIRLLHRGVLALTVIAFLGGASAGSAQPPPYLLLIPSDIRSEGMGRGPLALDDEVLGLWGNVAGVAWGRGTEIGWSRAHLVPDLADKVIANYVVGRQRLDLGNVRGGLAVQFGDLAYPGYYERLRGGAAGVRIPVGDRGWLGFGAGVKWVDIDGTFIGAGDSPVHFRWDATAWDLGLLAGVPDVDDEPAADWNWLAGLSLHNLGSLRIEGEEDDPLTRTLRAGAGVGRVFGRRPRDPHASPFALIAPRAVARVRLTGTIEKNIVYYGSGAPPDSTFRPSWFDEHRVILNGGAEVLCFDLLALRAGYIHDDPAEIKGFTWGFGLRLTEYVHLDMASIPQFEELDRVQKWGLSLRGPFPGTR